MCLSVEHDVPPNPMDVRLLGSAAVMSGTDGVPDALQKRWLRPVRQHAGRHAEHMGSVPAARRDYPAIGLARLHRREKKNRRIRGRATDLDHVRPRPGTTFRVGRGDQKLETALPGRCAREHSNR